MAACHNVHEQVIVAELASSPGLQSIQRFRKLNRFFQSIPKVRWFWNRYVFSPLYHRPAPDLPPIIRYEKDRWILS